jgi:3-dehydroquinate dehydratase
MIRIVLTSKKTNKIMCYHTVNRLDEADRYAAIYSRMEGIKTEIEVTQC